MKIDSQKSIILKSAFLLGWIAILLAILMVGWTPTWKALLVRTLSPSFADMRVIQGALKSVKQGFDPQLNNPRDPWNRPLNYPKIWLSIAKFFGLDNETNYLLFVSIAILCFLYCCYRIISKTNSPWTLLMVFSGATLFAVERGNIDIIVFSLVYCAACIPVQLMVPLLLTATALKIYPVLVFPALVRERVWAITFGICSVALLFFLLLKNELRAIRAATPVFDSLSYGSASIVFGIQDILHLKISQIFVSGVLIASAFAFYLKPFRFLDFHAEGVNEYVKRLFFFGACIFIGTFLLSSNYDYRLIFLLLCIPYVLLIQNKFARSLVLVCMFAATNQRLLDFILKPFRPMGPALSVLAKCILFASLGAILLNLLKTELDRRGVWAIHLGRVDSNG